MNNMVMKKLLLSLIRLRKCIFVLKYNLIYKKRILKRIQKKGDIKVFFLVINIGMWKSDKLFQLLLNDKNIHPYIVTSFIARDTPEYKEYVQNDIVDYCNHRGYPVIKTFDTQTGKCTDIKDLDADVIFYPQPYHDNIKEFKNDTLYGYIPYDYPIQDNKVFHNKLYHNICWRIFAVNDKYKELEESCSLVKWGNIKVVGYSNSDYYYDGHRPSMDSWKIKDTNVKRIIWAPHHSILDTDTMGQSLFCELAYSFLALTEQYEGRCQFVFKPHPRLKDKLYQLNCWGKDKTDEYYDSWKNRSNTNFIEGNYIDLFLTSDAMIHDCSSFIAEYLYTGHPVMFMTKKDYDYNLSENDCELFNSMYHGYEISDVKSFIDSVLLSNNDPKKNDRMRVLKEVLGYSEVEQVCERIHNEIQSLLI